MPLSAVRRMTIYDEQTTTMRVRWERAPGATGYMLLYSAINATQPTSDQEVRTIITQMVCLDNNVYGHSNVYMTNLGKEKQSTSARVYG